MTLATLIVGLDLSPGSEQALERAAGLAQLHGARLVLVHAQADDAPLPHVANDMIEQLGRVSEAMRIEEARQLAERLDRMRARGLPTELVGRTGPAGEVVAQVAADRDADLIVIGTHGRTGISRFLLGSVATAILRHAPCDVLVCRGAPGTGAFMRPLAATDFSPTALRALRHAAGVAAPGVAIDIVHAWQLPAGSWGATLLGQARFPWSTVRDAVLSSARAQGDALAASQHDLGHPLHVELVQGPPASVITHAAEHGGHDLIAIGTHGRGGFRRLLLGSVAESVVRHAPCSVLVAHGGETSKFPRQ